MERTRTEPTRRVRSARGRQVRRSAICVVAAGLLLAATACGGTKGGGAAPQGGDTLFIGTVNPVASWNAINQSDTAGQWALDFALDSLLVQAEPLDFQPKLAESFQTEDNRTYTVKLHPDAKWTDGEPITADDVVFTFNLIANHDSATTYGLNMTMFPGCDPATGKLKKGVETIPGLTAVDDHTVRFTMKTAIDPNWVKEKVGSALAIVPKHVWKDTAPDKIDDSPYAVKPNVFSGPYKISKVTNNVSIEYTANKDYYLGAPKIDKIIMKFMPAANLAGELQSGSIQMNAGGGIGNIPITDLPTVKKMDGVTASANKTLSYQTVQFNTKKLPSLQLRQGIAHAVNREQIVKQLLKGQAEIVDGPYTSMNPYLDKGIEPTPYDPAAAKKLIKESGWDTSKPIKFLVPTGNATREQAADVIEANLKAVGLTVQAERYDFPTVLAMEKKGQFDLGLMGLSANIDPDSSSYRALAGASNHSFWMNKKNEELLLKGKSEPDPAKRRKIYNELQQIWQQNMPILTTYSEYWVGAKSSALTVGGPNPFWEATLSNLQDWELATDG